MPAMENVALWHERDISHSSVERYIGPDATITLDFALARLTGAAPSSAGPRVRRELTTSGLRQLISFISRMTKADRAELVDDHHRIGERRIAQQPVQQRRLAGAEEAGEHRERDRLRATGIRTGIRTGRGRL